MEKRLNLYLVGAFVDRAVAFSLFKDNYFSISLKFGEFLVKFAKYPTCGHKFNKALKKCDCKKDNKSHLGNYVVPLNKQRAFSTLWRESDASFRSKERTQIRELTLSIAGDKYTKKELRYIYNLQNGKCYFCLEKLGAFDQKKAFEKDHLKPVSKGGTSHPKNMALLCKKCNQEKGNLGEIAYWKFLEKKLGKRKIAARKASVKYQKEKKKKLRND